MTCALLAAWLLLQKEPIDQAKVDAAIERGCAWLKGQVEFALQQDVFMSWERSNAPSFHQRLMELVLLTLYHGGVGPDDPDFKRLLDGVLAAPLETTYRVSLQAVLLQKLDARKYQDRIARCAQALLDSQCQNGQWCYGHASDSPIPPAQEPPVVKTGGLGKNPKPPEAPPLPRIAGSKKKPGCAFGDNSNSQYAALGLRACADAGIVLPPEALKKAREAWERTQKPDGSWDYGTPSNVKQSDPPGGSYGSMTAGGVAALAILKHLLKEPVKGDPKIAAGLGWLAKNFSVSENPGYRHHHFYFLYGLERAGDLVGTESIGSHAWYPEGARWLIDHQQGDGSWTSSRLENNVAATCFAVLFLRRATAPLPKISTGVKK